MQLQFSKYLSFGILILVCLIENYKMVFYRIWGEVDTDLNSEKKNGIFIASLKKKPIILNITTYNNLDDF